MNGYAMDLNSIIAKGNLYNSQIEGFGMNLESFLSDNKKLSPDAEKLTDMVISFLHEMAQESENDYLNECEVY